MQVCLRDVERVKLLRIGFRQCAAIKFPGGSLSELNGNAQVVHWRFIGKP